MEDDTPQDESTEDELGVPMSPEKYLRALKDVELPPRKELFQISDDKEEQPVEETDETHDHPKRRLPFSHWTITITGHLIAASLGLGLGYLVLHWLYPNKFPLPW
jgi:hypothetical protein